MDACESELKRSKSMERTRSALQLWFRDSKRVESETPTSAWKATSRKFRGKGALQLDLLSCVVTLSGVAIAELSSTCLACTVWDAKMEDGENLETVTHLFIPTRYNPADYIFNYNLR
jgi:hypothetical protein